MKIKAGSLVRREDFFSRDNLIEKAWELIKSGAHILIAAPRRVGKTSIMYYLMDNPRQNYKFLYLITESINKENEFYRRLVNKLLKSKHINKSQKILAFLENINLQ